MKRVFLYLILGLAALNLAGCKPGGKADAPAANREAPDPLLVTPAPELAARLKVAPVTRAEIRDTLRVPGSVRVDEQRVARIGSAVTGRVTEVNGVLGQKVKKGCVLATLTSIGLADAQLVYLKALAAHQLQARAVDRARILLAADVIGSAELQRRENELLSAEAELNAAADQLRVLGMSQGAIKQLAATRRIDSLTQITSTLQGTLIERKLTPGQVLQPADAAFTVADLSHVWVVAEVPEQDADLIEVGKEVEVEIPALHHRHLTGKLIYVSDTVNPTTRTVMVRTDLVNHDFAIKPDMLATMLIQARPEKRAVIPGAAVVREDNKDHVFVELAVGKYRMRPVTLGAEREGMRAVLGGLDEGEKVVMEGAFHLNNERRRKELE